MSVAEPTIEWKGTAGNNVWAGRGRTQKLAIVAHVMEGTIEGCAAWFANPASKASANYGVAKDGRIWCFVDPTGPDAPFANGLVQSPDDTVKNLIAAAGGDNLNFVTISIEHEGMSGEPLTAAQLDASGHLGAWLCERFGIRPDEEHLIGHYEIDSVTRARCPGWNRAGWLAWERAIAGYLQPTDTPEVADLKRRLGIAEEKLAAIAHVLQS